MRTTVDCLQLAVGFPSILAMWGGGGTGSDNRFVSGVKGGSSGGYGGGSSHHSGSGRYGGGCVQSLLPACWILTDSAVLLFYVLTGK